MADYSNLVKALLCRGEPQRVPLFEISIDRSIKRRYLGRDVDSQAAEVEFYLRAGYDFVPLLIGMRERMQGTRSGVLSSRPGEASVFRPLEARYNPFQEGTTTRLWAEEGRGVIYDRASFDNFDWPDPASFGYATLESLGRLLPENARVLVVVGGIFTCSWMLMGLEAFCIAAATGSELVPRLIQRVGEIQCQVVENVLQYGCVGAVCMPDDLGCNTGLLVHPRWLREHVFPWDQRIGQRVRARGLPYIYHSDGRIAGVIDDLIACGFQALHPCERASVDIDALKRRYAGRLCLCGNIDLDSTLTLGTPADVEAEVKARLRTVAPGGGYCCGASNSVPEYVPFENYLAMIETVKKFGTYPIRV